MSKVLITGGQGFLGSKLLAHLQSRGFECSAEFFDICDLAACDRMLKAQSWDHVFHFAALSHVPTCEKDPAEAARVNTHGTEVLLKSFRKNLPKARFYFTSTAQVYAAPDAKESQEGVVFDEKRKIAPQNTYARTKWEAEKIVEKSAREGARTITLRLFNHSHKSQSPDFFLPHLYSQMSGCKPGETVRIPVGNMDLYRDIGSVDDLVRAFEAVTESSDHETFNICSGKAWHLRSLAENLARALRVHADFVLDPTRLRPGEPRSIRGSHEKLTRATGWRPTERTESELIQAFLA